MSTGAGDGIGDARCVPVIFGPVGGIDLVVEAVVSICEGRIPVDAPGSDPTLMAYSGAAEPGGPSP